MATKFGIWPYMNVRNFILIVLQYVHIDIIIEANFHEISQIYEINRILTLIVCQYPKNVMDFPL